jgi:hypothetical protein
MNRTLLAVVWFASMMGCSQNTVDARLAKWCQVQPGNTKEQLLSIMGAPTSDATTSLSWSTPGLHLGAFLDPDGTVRQLDISLDSPTAAEKAALKCGEVRTRRSVAAAAAAAGRTPSRTSPHAQPCALVSEAEMSAILGAPVVAEVANKSSSKCTYKATHVGADLRVGPYVELSVDWGDGKIAMSAMGLVEKHEPGLTSPYDGIGDQAAAVGPALMIRTGEDLVTIVFSGVSDAPAKARRIFETAKPRM